MNSIQCWCIQHLVIKHDTLGLFKFKAVPNLLNGGMTKSEWRALNVTIHPITSSHYLDNTDKTLALFFSIY